MANEEHLARLKQGVHVWNQWRRQHPAISQDLRGADLSNMDLRSADLSKTDLREANLRGANLRWANLRWANLREADLRGADLRGAMINEADQSNINLDGAILTTSLNLRQAASDETTEHEIEVEIGLPQENINLTDIEQLQTAIEMLMDACGFRLRVKLAPIKDSWWQTLIFWSKSETTQAVVERLFQTLKELFVARSIGIPSAEETAKLAEAVDRVLKSLEPFESGVIRFGKLLVIKGTLKGKPVLRVETISLSLAQKLAENPQLIKMPESLLYLIEEEGMADQTTSDLAPLEKSRGEFLPEEPSVQLPPKCSGLQ
jgi:hypothetical protein